MTVFLNEKPFSINPEVRLESFLKEINMVDFQGVAIAINEKVIPRSEWEKFCLRNNDSILLIKATAGG